MLLIRQKQDRQAFHVDARVAQEYVCEAKPNNAHYAKLRQINEQGRGEQFPMQFIFGIFEDLGRGRLAQKLMEEAL